MMTVNALKIALTGLNGAQIDALAAASKVPASTIYKIRSGETSNPRGNTIELLSKGLRSSEFSPQREAA